MATEPTTCSKCKADLERGFLADYSVLDMAPMGLNSRIVWFPGKPEFNTMGAIKVNREEKKALRAWHCTKCGFIELYTN